MSKTRILLTGGSGLVGQNLLGSAGADEYEISAPSSKDVNLLDFNVTLDHMRQFKPDMIIHTAGLVGGIQANLENPFSFLVENLDLGRNVVMAAREAGIPRLMNLGSSCMYPRDIDTPLSEDMILTGELEPTNEGYALAKITVARMCRYLSAQDDRFDYKTLIPCNLFGPFDNFDPLRSHLVPAIIAKVHQAKIDDLPSVEIWGDGSARREFMFVGELVDFIWHAMGQFETLPDLINVGKGQDYSILEYYETVAKVLGWQGEFTFDLERPVGMMRKLISTDQLGKTGWQTTASLEDGIRETYRYFQENVIGENG